MPSCWQTWVSVECGFSDLMTNYYLSARSKARGGAGQADQQGAVEDENGGVG